MIPKSALPGFVFPAVPSSYAGIVAHLLRQLNSAERLPPERMRQIQFGQLTVLLRHAFERSPFWRRRLEEAGWSPQQPASETLLARLPPLTRADLQDHFETLRAQPLDATYGRISVYETSGSTGRAVRVEKCRAQGFLYDAITMRDHLWHRRDFSKKFASIRPNAKIGSYPDWGMPIGALTRTGPTAVMDFFAISAEEQLDWLIAEKPDYFSAPAGRVAVLAHLALDRGRPLDTLRRIITYGSVVSDETRDIVRRAFNVEIDDRYTAEEIGHIATQCELLAGYHVQSESVIVEVVDGDGRPVPVGEAGRVLVTVLHSFAMPLIRYQMGDMAIPGPACRCGRTLPVLERILGRELTILRLPNGRVHQVIFIARELLALAPIRDFRVVMYADDEVDVFLTADQPVAEAARENIRRLVQEKLGYPFPVQIRQVAEIDWGKSWKREPFVRLKERRR